jgi:hypothetical protein
MFNPDEILGTKEELFHESVPHYNLQPSIHILRNMNDWSVKTGRNVQIDKNASLVCRLVGCWYIC